jgi:hypothetical protein
MLVQEHNVIVIGSCGNKHLGFFVHQKEENLTENHTTPMVSIINAKNQSNEEN